MGPAIVAIARIVGTASAGYWLNDFATWVNNLLGLGTKTYNKTQSAFSWWYLAIILIVLAAIVSGVLYFIQMLVPVRRGGRRRKR